MQFLNHLVYENVAKRKRAAEAPVARRQSTCMSIRKPCGCERRLTLRRPVTGDLSVSKRHSLCSKVANDEKSNLAWSGKSSPLFCYLKSFMAPRGSLFFVFRVAFRKLLNRITVRCRQWNEAILFKNKFRD